MPKSIVVLCDGTWNSPRTDTPTHVERLKTYFDANPHDPNELIWTYVQGVGTGARALTKLGKVVDKLGGGAMGIGLTKNIMQAYVFIAQNYEPGDRLYLFGFSRGAFTVRSLAGMIRKSGLPEKSEPDGKIAPLAFLRALALYRKRGRDNAPDKRHIMAVRERISPRFATSAKDLAFRDSPADLIEVTYLGVWDTVGAMGVPNLLGAVSKLINRRHAFHDMVLSRMVKSARHAMALDEKRYFFKPAGWVNMPTLNERAELEDGRRPYQQVWFAGDHGMLGGSGANAELTSHTIDWVLDGAKDAGLDIDRSQIMPDVLRNPLNRDPIAIKTKFIYKLWSKLHSWRDGPKPGEDTTLSVPARTLYEQDPGYRPGSLKQFFSDDG